MVWRGGVFWFMDLLGNDETGQFLEATVNSSVMIDTKSCLVLE